jgi:hypothetical protein
MMFLDLGKLLKMLKIGIVTKLYKTSIATVCVDHRQGPKTDTAPKIQLTTDFHATAENIPIKDHPAMFT